MDLEGKDSSVGITGLESVNIPGCLGQASHHTFTYPLTCTFFSVSFVLIRTRTRPSQYFIIHLRTR